VDPALITKEFFEEFKKTLLTPTDLFLQVEPLGLYEDTIFPFEFFQRSTAPFRRFIEPVTALLNLTLPETELMTSFAEKGRYNIRLAAKR
jgi:lipid II:glycine glycyltransferase (peptidoglycan interpeptide bridge formation enzyme)